MRKLNVKSRVVLGLVGMMMSLVMLAFYLGIIPDHVVTVREGRAALAESIAVHCTASVLSNEFQRLGKDFNLMTERNADLLTLALRRLDGRLLFATGDHVERWQNMGGEYSRETQVRVPIWSGDHKWGQLELRFSPLYSSGFIGFFERPIISLSLFLGLIGFASFYFYMGKVLRHLDPSKAIPGRVRSALDTLAGGLLVIDREEQIVLANKSFGNLFGKASQDLLGHRAGDLPWVDDNDHPLKVADRPWAQAIKKGEMQTNRILRLRLPNGERLSFNVNCSPVLGSGGYYAGALVSFDDITLLEKKEIELRRSKVEAEIANQAKSAFLANMSHEIRTPMTAILGFTEILKRGYGKTTKDNLRHLDTISASGKNLLDLINDILDLSKVESGRLEMEQARAEPHLIIQEVLNVLTLKAGEKKVVLTFKPQGPLPEKITTDPARFRQIIFNLVGNAIKFTENGKVTVTCRCKGASATGQLVVEVMDTGIGIPADKLEAIFDPFSQADLSTTRQFGGTGLGLSISREFARALGGNIVAASESGLGSTFTVTLATGDLDGVAMIDAEQAMNLDLVKPAEQIQWHFPDALILVVDDGAENRELLRLVLEETGVSVDEAENGKLGIAKAVSKPYDVIFMDVNMPVMDGMTAAKHLRKQGLKTPIIALTANAMKGYEQECLKAGYTGYFSKPIDIDKLLAMMGDLLGGEAMTAETQIDGQRSTGDVPKEKGAEQLPRISSSLSAQSPRFRNLISRFVAKLIERVDAAEQSFSLDRQDEVADFAHWVKGAGGSVGFDVLTEPSAKLEQMAKSGGSNAEIQRALGEIRALAHRLSDPEDRSPETVVALQRKPDPSPSVQVTEKGTKPPDTTEPLISRLNNHPRLQSVIHKFVEKLREEVIKAKLALEADDLETLGRFAHWLKGSGGTVGFDAFTAPAEKLETFAKNRNASQAGTTFDQIVALSNRIDFPAGSQINEGEPMAKKSA